MKYTKVLANNANKLILIDADIVYNRAAFSCETSFSFEGDTVRTVEDSHVADLFHRLIMGILYKLDSNRFLLCWSSATNFRTSVSPLYKKNRETVKRPVVSAGFLSHIKGRYPSTEVNKLEADDVMGLLSSEHPASTTIIASDDKDMLTIPGMVYKPRKPELGVLHVCEDEAKYNWYRQVLMGDRVDGYTGIPGVGVKKSEKLLKERGVTWKTVVDAYAEADLSEQDAIVTAQLARILHPGEWDYNVNAPKLWHP
jgi:5'-3' exonuclease